MPQYMLSVHNDASKDKPYATDEEMQAAFERTDKFNARCMEEGVWVFGGGLFGPETATVVDYVGTEVVVTDGPYSETKEFLGGFWVLELPDLDTAMKYVAYGSKACAGKVEVRPFQSE